MFLDFLMVIPGDSLFIGVIICAVIALVVCLVSKAKMRTAVAKREADGYIDQGGVEISLRKDQYIRTSVVRVPINRDNHGSHRRRR